jgi:hypothetical protein
MGAADVSRGNRRPTATAIVSATQISVWAVKNQSADANQR